MRLRQLPLPARLTILLFVLFFAGFYALAQGTLWVREGGGRLPDAQDILAKYHGSETGSRMHRVLDPALSLNDPRAMWVYLDPLQDEALIAARRKTILDWVEDGTPEAGWAAVARVLHQEATCLTCHAFGGEKQDLPFETMSQVQAVSAKGEGMPLASLLTSAHNHAFGFGMLLLVFGLGCAFTGLPATMRVLLPLAAFVGGAMDLGGWFLARTFGAPFHLVVLVGGALFGLALAAMALAVLVEVVLPRP